MVSGVFRRGAWCVALPPLAQLWKNFYRRLYIKMCTFCRFPARIAKFNNVWWSFFIPIQYAIKVAMRDCIWYDAVIFCVFKFQSNFRKNGQICGFHWTFKSKKCFSFRGASPPWPPDQGLRPQTPVIGSRSTRSPCPPCQILNTPLVMVMINANCN